MLDTGYSIPVARDSSLENQNAKRGGGEKIGHRFTQTDTDCGAGKKINGHYLFRYFYH